MSELRINIHSRNDKNTIADREYPKFGEAVSRIASMGSYHASRNVRIAFEPSAVGTLFESIDWGKRYQYGVVEKAGIIIGNYYRDLTGGTETIWGDVVAVVPADPELVNASFTDIDITTAAWQKMYEDASVYRDDNKQILGWYHTHLDTINTRFSSVDRITQRRAFTYEYSFGIVMNPNQERWSAFYGPDSAECAGEIILDEALEAQYGKPKIRIMQVSGDSELQENGKVVHLEDEGHPYHTRPDGTPEDELDENDPSLRQAFGQLFIDIGKWMSKPRKKSQSRFSLVRSNSYDPVSSPETRRSGPKIAIGNIKLIQPTVKYRYFNISPNGKLDELVNHWGMSLDKDIVKAVQQRRKRDVARLWGEIKGPDSNKTLTIRGDHDPSVNAEIIFIQDTIESKITELTAMGAQSTDQINKQYTIIINDDSSRRRIEALVIYANRGAINERV